MKQVWLGGILALALSFPAAGQNSAPAPTVAPALDAIFAAFDTHPIVALGDRHGLAQEADFYTALIRDPRFAKQVGNVVVEFGGARDQAILDRYLNGEDVPYVELRKAWTDTPGIFVGNLVAANFFAQVRAVNLTLPPAQRIRVWLGEPVIDWDKIKVREAFEPIVASRDAHAADIILYDIVAKHRKTLAIYGSFHFDRHQPVFKPRPKPTAGAEARTRQFIADATRGTLEFTAMTDNFSKTAREQAPDWQRRFGRLGPLRSLTYHDLFDSPDGDGFDATFAKGKVHVALGVDATGKLSGAFVNSVTWELPRLIEVLDKALPGATYVIEPYDAPDDRNCPRKLDEATTRAWPAPSVVTPDPRDTHDPQNVSCNTSPGGDALIYFGPAETLTAMPLLPDLYMDMAYRKQIAHIETIRHMSPGVYGRPPDMSAVTNAPTPIEKPSPRG